MNTAQTIAKLLKKLSSGPVLPGGVRELALGYADGLRAGGIAEIRRDAPVLVDSPAALKALATRAKRLAASRDGWKDKAKRRQVLLEKNRITTRDLKKSRSKWRNEAMDARSRRVELEGKLADSQRTIESLAGEVGRLHERLKKKRNR